MTCKAAPYSGLRLLFFSPIFLYHTFRLFFTHISASLGVFLFLFHKESSTWTAAELSLFYMQLCLAPYVAVSVSFTRMMCDDYCLNVCKQKCIEYCCRSWVCHCLPVFYAPLSMQPSVYKAIKRCNLLYSLLFSFTFQQKVQQYMVHKVTESLTNLK